MNLTLGSFTPEDLLIGKALGTFIALALKRQYLLDELTAKKELEKELNIAHAIQQGLLPTEKPLCHGYDISGWNKAAAKTGGDCFDFFSLKEECLGIMIADASGHGICPAFLITQWRSMLLAMCQSEKNLENAIGTLNRLLFANLPDGCLVTVFFACLNRSTHIFHYISAGFPPITLYRAITAQVTFLEATQMPLGISQETLFSAAFALRIDPGDTLVILTD